MLAVRRSSFNFTGPGACHYGSRKGVVSWFYERLPLHGSCIETYKPANNRASSPSTTSLRIRGQATVLHSKITACINLFSLRSKKEVDYLSKRNHLSRSSSNTKVLPYSSLCGLGYQSIHTHTHFPSPRYLSTLFHMWNHAKKERVNVSIPYLHWVFQNNYRKKIICNLQLVVSSGRSIWKHPYLSGFSYLPTKRSSCARSLSLSLRRIVSEIIPCLLYDNPIAKVYRSAKVIWR